ncbi:sensor histidine kinase [Arenibaculum pallidiluteum]|uniref:sensor histidine kinase n=1 Tax=Arenibaculum pallidiluteum TaxID=2812559 RepID=UPI001A97402A|nr:HAMP domain-containing sensor histidine kinase [Arenibaculum pallidiluteum]
MRRSLLVLAALGALTGLTQGAFWTVMSSHHTTLTLVKVSGRQGLLSQHAVLQAMLMAHAETAKDYETAWRALAQATAELADAHGQLANAATEDGDPLLLSLYFDPETGLDRPMRRALAVLERIAGAPTLALRPGSPELAEIVAVMPTELLERIGRTVREYQEIDEAAHHRLAALNLATLLLTLLTLVAAALWVFRPTARLVQRQVDEIAAMNGQLARWGAELETQVDARTRELDAARRRAERASEAKSRFLAMASHDLLSPLEAMGLFMRALGRRIETDPQAEAILSDMRAAKDGMRRLLRALLDLAAAETGAVRPVPRATGLMPVLQRLGRELGPQAEAKGLRLIVGRTTATALTDPDLLERILRNLLGNAVRYTRSGGVLLGCRRRGNELRVEVWDTGPGIAESDQERIFEEFAQLATEGRDRSQGIGLGLAIADRLARLLGHRLELQSRLGRGSVFAVVMPAADAPQKPEGRPQLL